jgi:hypothetical protein
MDTIRATSMTVTAMASRIEPNGSPSLRARTSAWWTAAKTLAPSRTTARINTAGDWVETTPPSLRPKSPIAKAGASVAHSGIE